MVKYLFALAAALISSVCVAQTDADADSLAYQLQRKKINRMLSQRISKFAQYDQSLSEHTGIFGLQTKKDIRRSNDILIAITQTDNAIFKELKTLLDYRAFEQKQVQSENRAAQTSNLAFMNTINKLRRQNDALVQQAKQDKAAERKSRNIFIGVIVVLIITSILQQVTRKRAVKG